MNYRKLSTELNVVAIKQLESAKDFARTLGLELNTHVTFTPYCEAGAIPAPVDVAVVFRRFLKQVGMWVPRHTRRPFTYLRVAHTDDDGSGRNPHLHVLMHLPGGEHRNQLEAALLKVYGTDVGGGLVCQVKPGTDRRVRHESGYWGSTFDYITRHKTQQAYRAQGGSTWRASRRDANGRHRGIKTPFVGRRLATSHNINARAREAYDDARRRTLTSARATAERQRLAA